MNRLRSDALDCMSGLTREGERLSATFKFPENFIGFEGHFPQAKVLPGICQIECAAGMIERTLGREARLTEIVNAKFVAPVLPDEEIACSCGPIGAGDELLVKALFTRAGAKVSDIKFKVTLR